MSTPSARFGIPLPAGSDLVSRANRTAELMAVEGAGALQISVNSTYLQGKTLGGVNKNMIGMSAADVLEISQSGTTTSILDALNVGGNTGLSGNLSFGSTGRRITADMSSATLSSRLGLQSSVVNGVTVLPVIPNGTAVQAGFYFLNTSNPDASGRGYIYVNAAGLNIGTSAGSGVEPAAINFIVSAGTAVTIAPSNGAVTFAAVVTMNQSLTLGTARRIISTGDDANPSNRLQITSSGTNAMMMVGVFPSGTGTQAGFTFHNTNLPNVSGAMYIQVAGAVASIGTTKFTTGVEPTTLTITSATSGNMLSFVTATGAATFIGSVTAASFVGSHSGAFTPTGDLDMGNYLITNIGVAGTDFTSGGGLTLAAALTIAAGNLVFGTTGQRITGDFSNATISSRVAFQTSTVNGNTNISLIPNGTALIAQIAAYNTSDPSNAGYTRMASGGQITTGLFGTGTEPAALSLGSSLGTIVSLNTATGAISLNYSTTITSGNLTISTGKIVQTTSVAGEGLSLTQTDPGAIGSQITTMHSSASPALGDHLFRLEVWGRDTVPSDQLYGRLLLYLDDATSGSEDATWYFQNARAGTLLNAAAFNGIASVITGALSVTAGISPGTSTFAIGSLYTSATQGLVVAGGSGSVNDLLYANAAGVDVLKNPHGTTNLVVVGSVTAGSFVGPFGAVTANLDMANFLLLNIGAAGTDFTTGGGLTLAALLTVNATGSLFSAGTNLSTAITVGAGGTAVTTSKGATLNLDAPSAAGALLGTANIVFRRTGASIWELGVDATTASGAKVAATDFYLYATGVGYAAALSTAGTLTLAGGLRVETTIGFAFAPVTNAGINLSTTTLLSGATSQYGIISQPTMNRAATVGGSAIFAHVVTEAFAFTMTNAYGVYVAGATVGAGSTITNTYGVYVQAQTSSTSVNYGIYVEAPTGSNSIGLRVAGGVLYSLYVDAGSTYFGTGTARFDGAIDARGPVTYTLSQNGLTAVVATNTNTGAAAYVGFSAIANTATMFIGALSTNYGSPYTGKALIQANATAGLMIQNAASGAIQFYVNSTTQAANFASNGVSTFNYLMQIIAGLTCQTITPTFGGTYDLGTTGARWLNVWCTNGAFNGSHSSLKHGWAEMAPAAALEVARGAHVGTFRYKEGGETTDWERVGILADHAHKWLSPDGASVSPQDTACLALAAAVGVDDRVEAQGRYIVELERRLAALEAR